MFDGFFSMFGKKKRSASLFAPILVVDDNEIDRKIIVSTLNKRGFETITANNGQEGLEMVKAQRPSLIVLDCEMPVMNGPDMCQHLKDDETTQNIPILFLTSIDTPKNVVECFQLDAENFLSKPIKPQVLTAQIDLILKEFLKK